MRKEEGSISEIEQLEAQLLKYDQRKVKFIRNSLSCFDPMRFLPNDEKKTLLFSFDGGDYLIEANNGQFIIKPYEYKNQSHDLDDILAILVRIKKIEQKQKSALKEATGNFHFYFEETHFLPFPIQIELLDQLTKITKSYLKMGRNK